ncbi:MAG: protein translocase subunit SecD [Solirubrobacteraceae bacterium]
MSDRSRNGLILLLVAGLIAASLVVVATKKTRLGLDLKGGVELVYQGKPTPQQPKVDAAAIDRALEIMRKRVDKLGVSEPEIQRSGRDQIVVGLPDVKNAARAQQQVGKVAQLFFYDWEPNVIGPDGQPSTAAGTPAEGQAVSESPIPSLYDAVLRASKRKPQRDGDNTTNDQYYLFGPAPGHRLIAGPEESEADLLTELEGREKPRGSSVLKVPTGTLVIKAEEIQAAEGQPKPKDQADRYYVVDDDPSLSGLDIENPEQNFDQGTGGNGAPIVTMDFTDKGQKAFQSVTRTIAQRGAGILRTPGIDPLQKFAIVLDNEIISRPTIDFNENPDGIDGRTGAQITGSFTIQEAQDLATNLEIGALPIKLELISQSQVSATLGKEALDQGLLAGAIGFLIVALFLLLFYRVLGVIAVAALGIYALYLFALVKLIPITMSLPGIAGLVLTIGVAADANIVIFERVKEEVRGGATIPRGIATGYKKGLTAIIDANVVTLMTAFILFILATAGVKGFAFTLGVGTITSLFTAVLATQAILGTMGRSRLLSRPSALGAGPQSRRWTFDFMGASKWFFSMSGVILLVGALAIGGKGLNFGIDFESGSRITTALSKPASEDDVRAVMDRQGFADAKIQKLSNDQLGDNVFQISTPTLQPAKVQQVRAALNSAYGVGDEFSNNSIGPTFGQTVARTAVIAIFASLLVISGYIALRFEWKYAVPVLIAVLHDLLITAGVYSLTDREVTTSTVAALLTILGFSLYDTIIVFDRVRENVPRMPRASFSQIVNRSMAEVLTRSLATSFCTLLPVLSLYLFGGETLKDFAFALIVGIASGAYSSVFIASPVLTHWKEREKVCSARTARLRQESPGGIVPAYAVATAGGPAEVAPAESRAQSRRASRRLTTPEEPGEISADEFEELKRQHAESLGNGEPAAGGPLPARARSRRAAARTSASSSTGATPASGDGGEGAGEDTPKPSKPKRPRNRRHGRAR